MDELLNKITGDQEQMKERKLDERLAKIEVTEVMNDIVNKVSANFID